MKRKGVIIQPSGPKVYSHQVHRVRKTVRTIGEGRWGVTQMANGEREEKKEIHVHDHDSIVLQSNSLYSEVAGEDQFTGVMTFDSNVFCMGMPDTVLRQDTASLLQ